MGLCLLSKSSIVTFIILKSTSIKFGVLKVKKVPFYFFFVKFDRTRMRIFRK